jgi:hypothetical protein
MNNKIHLMINAATPTFVVECSTKTSFLGINALGMADFHRAVENGSGVCQRCLPKYRKRLAKIRARAAKS